MAEEELGLTMNDATLDKALLEVSTTIPGDGKKSSITVYYLLTEKPGELGVLAETKSG